MYVLLPTEFREVVLVFNHKVKFLHLLTMHATQQGDTHTLPVLTPTTNIYDDMS